MSNLRKSIIVAAFAAALPGLAFANEAAKTGQSAAPVPSKPAVAQQQKIESKAEQKADAKAPLKVEKKDVKTAAPAAKGEVKAQPVTPTVPAAPTAPGGPTR